MAVAKAFGGVLHFGAITAHTAASDDEADISSSSSIGGGGGGGGGGDGVGVVCSTEAVEHRGELFHVLYEDGDEEDLGRAEAEAFAARAAAYRRLVE